MTMTRRKRGLMMAVAAILLVGSSVAMFWPSLGVGFEIFGFAVLLLAFLLLLHSVPNRWAESPEHETGEAAVDARVYGAAKANMQVLKILLQQLIGLAIIALLAIKTVLELCPKLDIFKESDLEAVLVHTGYLKVVGSALSVSAGVELAYMLFTPGPDEAVEPLILGVAGAVLLAVSEDHINFAGSAWLVALLAGLIAIRVYLMPMLKPDLNRRPTTAPDGSAP